MPHVIKSFSRSRGSKGKERRTLERAQAGRQGEARGKAYHGPRRRGIVRAVRTTKDSRTGGREREVEWGETEGSGR